MDSLKKKLGHAIICPFDQYIKQKEDFFSQHPNAKIIEEIKSLFIGQIGIPDSRIIGAVKPVQALMISWAIVYEEKIKSDSPILRTV